MSEPALLDALRPETAAGAGVELETRTRRLLDALPDAPITDAAGLQAAVVERQELGAAMKTIEAYFAPLKSAAYRLHRELCDREAAVLAPLRARDRARVEAMQAFDRHVEAERRQHEQALAEAARRERDAIAAAEAAALESAGERATAEAVLHEAITAPAPVAVAPDPLADVSGYKTRRTYKWRYVGGDRAAALRLIPREYLTPDETKIGAYARAMKGSGTIPGIEFYAEDVPVR